MRVSRWGWSSYETEAALSAEAQRLSTHVAVAPRRSDAEILTVNSGTRVDAALLDQAPSARLVLTTTSGFDHLDLDVIRARGIVAGRCPMARRDAVVESALGLLLDGLRCHRPLTTASRAGRWARSDLPALGMRLLGGATVGVVGFGVIGKRMVQVLELLGATVVVHDPGVHPASVPLDTLARTCDAVTLHCRLEPGSRRLIDDAWLSNARGLVLVNTARGDIVDVDATPGHLDAGHLSYLGLDVFPTEPWPRLEASQHPRVAYLPHAAGFHVGLNTAVATELEAAVEAFVAGDPIPHRVA